MLATLAPNQDAPGLGVSPRVWAFIVAVYQGLDSAMPTAFVRSYPRSSGTARERGEQMPPLIPDWAEVFSPSTPILETFVRGTLTYLFLFVLLRLAHKRQAGALGMTDLLVVVLLADAAQNAMADDYRSVTDGALLVSTIVGWSVALEWLGYHIPRIEQFIHPAPLALVEDGKLIRVNMRKELVTYDELISLLREQGVEDVAEVKHARMEGDGQLSVIRQDQDSGTGQRRRPGAP